MKSLPWLSAADPWRVVLTGFALLLGTALLLALQAGTGLPDARVLHLVAGAALGLSWLLTVRFALLVARFRRFWTVSLLVILVLVLFAGRTGLVLGLVWSAFFLAPRRYRSWRLVSDRRRAVGFGLGVLALAAVVVGWRFWTLVPAEGFRPLRGLGGWSLVCLAQFWAWSMFHLAMGMRLHFLRLRPKLAVSAVLIGFVPLLLVGVLGLLALYTGLGGARAARADAMLEGWRRLTAQGVDLAPALFDTTRAWPAAGDSSAAWLPQLATALQRTLAEPEAADEEDDEDEDAGAADTSATRTAEVAAATAVAHPGQPQIVVGGRRPPVRTRPAEVPADTTGWFIADRRLWLIRWQGLDTPQPRAQAWLLNRRPLTELSRVLRVGVAVSPTSGRNAKGDFVINPGDNTAKRHFDGVDACYRDPATTGGFFRDILFFGGTLLTAGELRGDRVHDYAAFVRLRVGAADLKADFVQGDSNLNVAIVIVLGLVAVMFLVIECFALFFGVRITEGIVTGVHALHRGTRAVAAGDLDTVIAIPNEDEFGDLARSFNEMTMAVKHGREIALANERLTQELSTARAIQVRLLPGEGPSVPGYEVTGASIPSREIGGDYYDFLAQGDDAIGIAIGDVSGKGMPAALLMSNLQASLHGQVLHRGTVASVVERVNDLLVRSTDAHMFATFFYGVLETATGRFTCTNAGHNPPLVIRNDGSLQRLTTGGLLLGMVGDMIYQQDTVELAKGEVIVMYTDGITEAVSPGADEEDPDAMFGEERLCEVLQRSRHLPASGIQDAILAAVADHTRGVAQSDDITLVVIRRQE